MIYQFLAIYSFSNFDKMNFLHTLSVKTSTEFIRAGNIEDLGEEKLLEDVISLRNG